MRTVCISASPKKRWSNSAYLLAAAKRFIRGEKESIHFRGAKDYPRIFDALLKADALVLAMPVYVDAVPSHVLELLQKIEQFAKEHDLHFRVYALCNCGFYEGEQCELEMEMLQCWCERAGLTFCGGTGVGAGEMIGFLPLVPIIGLAAMLLEFLIRLSFLIGGGMVTPAAVLGCLHPMVFLISAAVGILFSMGPWAAAAKLGKNVSAAHDCGIHYTTVSFCPAFLFVFFASIYWALRAFFMHFVPVWRLFRRQ